jgi:hypothetical protein
MSQNTSEVQRHRFGPRAKGGIVFGLRGGQLGIMTAVLVLMTIAVRSTCPSRAPSPACSSLASVS